MRKYTTSLLLPAVLAAGVGFAQEVISPAPITANPQRPTATANGYIVVFAQGTSPNARANAIVAAPASKACLSMMSSPAPVLWRALRAGI